MKTYQSVFRAVLLLATISLLLIGALSSYQRWEGSKHILTIGLLLFMVMIADHYIHKRMLARREKNPKMED